MTDLPSQTRATSMLELAIRCLDLTSLDGSETPEQIESLCAKAIRPDRNDQSVPSVAAVVLYPVMVSLAVPRLKGSGVKVASVAGFPSATEPLEERLEETLGPDWLTPDRFRIGASSLLDELVERLRRARGAE